MLFILFLILIFVFLIIGFKVHEYMKIVVENNESICPNICHITKFIRASSYFLKKEKEKKHYAEKWWDWKHFQST